MELRKAFEELYRPRQLRSASKDTIRLWDLALRLFDANLGRPATLDDLNDDAVCRFASWRLQTVAPATVNRDLASILAIWRWLHRHNLVAPWPDVQLEKEPLRTPVAWTQEEFIRLIRVCRSTRGRIDCVPANIWWTSLLLICFDSGERIGAVMKLAWNDVDTFTGWVTFRAENRKGRDQDNVVRLANDTRESLGDLIRHASSKAVFPWPYRKNYLWKRYGDLLAQAKLPNDRRRKFHCVRRTTASHVEAAGGNATEVLKHASRRNTLTYLDPRITKPPQATDLLWRPE